MGYTEIVERTLTNCRDRYRCRTTESCRPHSTKTHSFNCFSALPSSKLLRWVEPHNVGGKTWPRFFIRWCLGRKTLPAANCDYATFFGLRDLVAVQWRKVTSTGDRRANNVVDFWCFVFFGVVDNPH